jgi:hypothetical protein
MTPHEAKLSELAQRVVAIDHEVAQLDDRYATLVNQFDSADRQGSLKQAAQIEARTSELRRERALVNAARARIEELQKTELIEIEEQAKRQQLQQAREIADAICASHVEIDRILVTLREQLERRASLLGQLQRSDAVDSALVNRLSTRAVATRALCAAGLAKHFDVQTVAPNSMVPLARANAILLAIGRPTPPATETSEPNGGGDGLERRRPLRKASSKNGGDR